MPPLRFCLTAALLLCACAPPGPSSETPPVVDDQALESARRFQAEYEQQLRADDHSFLTTIAAYYLAPGERLRLDDHDVEFECTDAGMIVHMGETAQQIDDHALIPADPNGRFALAISRQDHDFRVLVHARDAPRRTSFSGIDWFPIEPALILDARFEPRTPREPRSLQTSRGLSKTLWMAGEAVFELDGRSHRLQVFGYAAEPSADEPLLIPFRDLSSGEQSYAAGRYLEPLLPPGEQLRLDFNRATNPLCAYSEHYNCPMPPSFNVLPVAIRAGAKAPSSH
jgi:uncharacterized protein